MRAISFVALNLSRLVFFVVVAPFVVVGAVFHIAVGGFHMADAIVGKWVDSL